MDDVLGNIATGAGIISIVISSIVAWRSLSKASAEGRKADADTYAAWANINDKMRDEVEEMHKRISEMQRQLDQLQRENGQLKARVQSLEHENRVLREQLERYEDSGVFRIPKKSKGDTSDDRS